MQDSWNKSIDAIDCFPLSKAEWDTLFRISIQQTVEGIVFDGDTNVEFSLFPLNSILKWLVMGRKN